MVALLHPQPSDVVAKARRHLRLVSEDQPASAAIDALPLFLVVAVVLAGFGSLRVLRANGPAVDGWAPEVALVAEAPFGGAAVATAGPQGVLAEGEQLWVAQPGDSLWSIAQSLAPGQDPRPAVQALRDRNGGSEIQIGQKIVIPVQLLD